MPRSNVLIKPTAVRSAFQGSTADIHPGQRHTWLGELTHIFQAMQAAITPAIRLLDMPPEAAPAFLFDSSGVITVRPDLRPVRKELVERQPVTVAAVVMTLFCPAAQF